MRAIYVLTSDESDFYLEQLALSLYSLKLHNPDLKAEVVMDKGTSLSLDENRRNLLKSADTLTVIDVPEQYDKMHRSRWLKTGLCNLVEGDYLFIDTDTIICGKLAGIELTQGDISAVSDLHVSIKDHAHRNDILSRAGKIGWEIDDENLPYHNSGVVLVRGTDKAKEFYRRWNEEWIISASKGCASDQPSFCKVNQESGHIITPLDNKWNCQVSENGIRYLHDAVIIHYFASGRSKAEAPYIFNSKKIYEEVRREGMTSCIQEMIENPKGAFIDKVQLISDTDVDFFNTPLAQYLRKFFYAKPALYNKLVKLGRKLKHL